jgi:glycosyltransferase involved in cell wall biosynthesis
MKPAYRIILIAPCPPPYGGMALQARSLHARLCGDGNDACLFASNFPLPWPMRGIDRVPGFRTLLRFALLWPRLSAHMHDRDIVHVLAASWSYFFLVVYPVAMIARVRKKRLVINYRGGEAARFFEKWGWIVKPVFQFADAVTTPSEFLARIIRTRFNVPVQIVPNILDLRAFQYRQRRQFRPALLVTRHLEKMYDIESVLRAFHLIQHRWPEASLTIAGAGSEAHALRNLAAELRLQHVRFLGHVPHSDLPALYDECDILVNASRVDNFPGSLLEASAAGLVIVSTNAGGIPVIYEHEKTALLVEVGDWNSLAAAVERIVSDTVLGVQLTATAARVAAGCDWEEVRRLLYKAYGAVAREEEMCIAG